MILSTEARNAIVAAFTALLDAGDGAGKAVFRDPSNGAVATLTLDDPAFGEPSNGTAAAGTITPDTDATGGTFTKLTLEDSNGNIHGTCSAGDGSDDEIEMSSSVVAPGVEVAIDSLTITCPTGSI